MNLTINPQFNLATAIICLLTFLSGCGGGDESSTNAVPVPAVSLNANPISVDYNGSTTLSWNASNVDNCIASGDWFGNQASSGSIIMNNLVQDSTYTLSCTGSGGSISKSVSVSIRGDSATTGSLGGNVDSSYINRSGTNNIYIYKGAVVPDDIDGDAVDPLYVAEVVQNEGGCEWSYILSGLTPGEYTVAFTNQGALDDSQQNDTLIFLGSSTLMITAGVNNKNIEPANILRVGPGRAYATPSAAAAVANDGDVIEIDSGDYLDDVVVWRKNNLVLRGVGGRAHMKATQIIPYTSGNDRENGMGIWVTRGSNIVVENIEFSGASVPDKNGAGIRVIGPGLTVCNTYFHDNENGILGGAGTLTIEYSEFNHNGLGDYGRTHNIYVDGGNKLIFRHNYSHHAYIGHNLKSRASENYVLYNRIMDEVDGRSSYAIDIPNGGLTYIIGNLIQQGTQTDNSSVVAYGAEGLLSGRIHDLYVVNNTFVNDYGAGRFLDINNGTANAKIINNIFTGGGDVKRGPGDLLTNLESSDAGLVNIDDFNYRLLASSAARNTGSDPGFGDGMDLTPAYQYVHMSMREVRFKDSHIDIGAYEYQPQFMR